MFDTKTINITISELPSILSNEDYMLMRHMDLI